MRICIYAIVSVKGKVNFKAKVVPVKAINANTKMELQLNLASRSLRFTFEKFLTVPIK